MKTLGLVALATFLVAPMAGAVPTSPEGYTVVARTTIPTVQTWQRRLGRELDQRLAHSARHGKIGDDGYAVIEFRCGPDGRAQNIALVHSSKDRDVNKTAMRAIAGLKKLHPMPTELKIGQKVRVNIVVAEDAKVLDRELRKLHTATPSRSVAEIDGERVIVLNAGLHVQG